MKAFKVSDHIYCVKLGYTHHGIYIGYNKVIHYSGFSRFGKKGKIEITTLKKFSNNSNVFKYPYEMYLKNKKFDKKTILERANSRIGENNYNLIFNNCESFANWCTHDETFSYQSSGMAEKNVRLNKYYMGTGVDALDLIHTIKKLFF